MQLSPFCHLHVAAACLAAGLLLAPGAHAQFPDAPRENLPPLPERKAAVLKQFDKDGDARLNTEEREAARKAWEKKKFSERGDQGFFGPPPELMEEFDTNKNGELEPEEGQKIGEVMGPRMEKVMKDYDKNSNGRLDEDEIARAMKDIDDGKLKGVPRMFVQFAGGPPGGRRGGPGGPRRLGGGPPGPGGPRGPGGPGPGPAVEVPGDELGNADRDQDGRLNADELEAIRAARAKRTPPAAPATPSR